jgi:O-antigen/teichoic acid export membrane protein
MSLKQNMLANVFGQLYAALVGVALVPLYVHYMGIEAFGLVGFYTMLQGCFMLLDMGLTPTISREAARFAGGAGTALDLRYLLRALEGGFLGLGLLGATLLWLSAGVIADGWLKVDLLDGAEVRRAIELMAVIAAIRWACGLYRGLLMGLERIVWLNAFGGVITTVRFVAVIPYLAYVGATPTHFFAFQLTVAIAEFAGLATQAYRLVPAPQHTGAIRFRWVPLRRVMPYALSTAAASTVWIVTTQADKLVLSGLLPLSEYAHFTLAVLIANVILLLCMPLGGAVLPRLTRLHAENDRVADLVRLYRDATQAVAVVAVPLVLLFALFPIQILTVWTGRHDLAAQAAPVLTLYAFGNGLLTMAAFPYYLQAAHGDLALHVRGNLAAVALFIPILWLMVTWLGMSGAGYAWVLINVLPFITWLPRVHRRFLPGQHAYWLLRDILAVALVPAAVAVMLQLSVQWPGDRLALLCALGAVYALLVALTAMSSSTLRSWVLSRLRWHHR